MPTLNRLIELTLIAALLWATPQRLPAPISEIESPTPTPARSTKPILKPKPRSTKAPNDERKEATAEKFSLTDAERTLNGSWILDADFSRGLGKGEITFSIGENHSVLV